MLSLILLQIDTEGDEEHKNVKVLCESIIHCMCIKNCFQFHMIVIQIYNIL